MLESSEMNDVKLHFRQRETPLGEVAGDIHEVLYPLYDIMICLNCKTGTFKECAEKQHRPTDGEPFSMGCIICTFRVR